MSLSTSSPRTESARRTGQGSVLTKDGLKVWLGRLLESHRVIAPAVEDGVLFFQPVSRPQDVVLEGKTAISPKGWVHPQTEVLFRVERRDGATALESPEEPPQQVLFGVRPCDARGIKHIDKVMLAEPSDGLYARRRERTALVGLACSQAWPECFCTSLGLAPDDASDVDVMLTLAGDIFLARAVTEKGKALLELAPLEDAPAGEPAVAQLAKFPTDGLAPAMKANFDSKYWAAVADRCIHCNICTFVCADCYCFDVRDAHVGGTVERLRCWDSCQAYGFTRIAGGYERRATKGERMRQRFAHKLLYYPEQFGEPLCTGCGRCVVACPVNIDIREIIQDVLKMGVKSATARAE
ncbi:MAG: 4Fe-4S dicluster domain-containing protein [Chloroflexi bacterium]|nr:4Fe-4S dicluster domain-containing protein [Chloroflexota bacterium]